MASSLADESPGSAAVDVSALSAMAGKQASMIIALAIAHSCALEVRYNRTSEKIFIV
jgi:hypothetical protein